MGPRLSRAQIVDFQLKLRFLINAPAQSQAVFALFSGGLQGQHQLGAWPGLVGDLPGGLLLERWQPIDKDHAVAPLGDGLPQHKLQAALAGPAGGQHELQGGWAWPGLTGHEEGMPAVAVAALIPEAEGNAMLQYIPNCLLYTSDAADEP